MNIASYSPVHKAILSLTIVILVMGGFLHNPIDGYVLEKRNPENFSGLEEVPCSIKEKEAYRAIFETSIKNGIKIAADPEKTKDYIENSIASCSVPLPQMVTLPVREWRTKLPFFEWIGNVINFVEFVLLVLAISISIAFIYKKAL